MTPTSDDGGRQDRISSSAARQRDVYRVIQDACFGAGWLTTGVILGAAGGWWALLSGPVLVAVVVMGGARYAKR